MKNMYYKTSTYNLNMNVSYYRIKLSPVDFNVG